MSGRPPGGRGGRRPGGRPSGGPGPGRGGRGPSGPPRGARDGARGPARGGSAPREHAGPPADQLVYGRNPVREVLRAERRRVHQIYATGQVAAADWLSGRHVHIVDADDLAEIAGSFDHQGVVAEVDPYPYVDLSKLVGRRGTVIVLDEITDPRNVGAIARTAEATGAVGLVLPERRAAQVNATVCKTSAGAIEHLRVAVVRNIADAVADLKAGGAWTYGAAMEGTPVGDLDLRGSVALVLGGEGKGLRPRVASTCDALVSLPMVGNVDSLNVSAAAAVLMYAAFTAQQ